MIKTIDWKKNKIVIIDQSKLPLQHVYVEIKDIKSLHQALRLLMVRGAPAIGVAVALGVALAGQKSKAKNYADFLRQIEKEIRYLASARPTAVNLFWALARMECLIKSQPQKSVTELKKIILKEALAIMEEDRKTCRKMAGFGASLIKSGDTILTHCNAGALATVDYGTALGVMYEAKRQGKKIKVYADETRPLLQGARLTAWELLKHGIDTTLICDNMAAALMSQGKIDKIFVGADRIAANGDTANKIGTYNVAIIAKYHRIPFYVVAPISTIDLKIKSGKEIPIEQRNPDEVRKFWLCQTAPKNVKVYNPAFDVTPNALISAIITEKGICRKPFNLSLRSLAG
jgi:methylthioribose-1-phosphate isomerase